MRRVLEQELGFDEDDNYLLDGEPFEGLAERREAGRLLYEREYRRGMIWGVSRGWFGSGCLEFEEGWGQGLLHGVRRRWDDEGRLLLEEEFEYGVRLWGKRWDAQGVQIEDFSLTESAPSFEILAAYRQAYEAAGIGMPRQPNPRRDRE